jgi:quercetin dioxygenase-like cupin family protein
MTEEEFRQQAREKGYGEPNIKEYGPNEDGDMHTHDATVMAMVTRGELTLALENESTTYTAGESCELTAGTLHCERTGADGATLLIATK